MSGCTSPALPGQGCQPRRWFCSTAERSLLSPSSAAPGPAVRPDPRDFRASRGPESLEKERGAEWDGVGKKGIPLPSLPPSPLPPSPGDGVQVKSLDFNGGIRLKSLNSARPHCAGVGGGERSAGGMGGLPAGRGLPPPLLWERGETSNALTSSNRAPKGPAAFAH